MIPILLLGLFALMIIAHLYNIQTEFEFEQNKKRIFGDSSIRRAKYILVIFTSIITALIISKTDFRQSLMVPVYVGMIIIAIIRIIEKYFIYKIFKGLIFKSIIILSPFIKVVLILILLYSFNNIWHYWKDHDPADYSYYRLSALLWGSFIMLIVFPIWISKRLQQLTVY